LVAQAVPAILVAAFPLAALPLALAGVVLVAWTAAQNSGLLHRIARAPATPIAARTAGLALALTGLAALVNDLTEIYATTRA
jgi:hypothetical protein